MHLSDVLLISLLLPLLGKAFTLPSHYSYTVTTTFPPKESSRPTILSATPILLEDVGEARTAFVIWFFGASGAAGIARSSFPRMYKQTRQIQSLADEGTTLGGETLGVSPLAGYPKDLSIQDIKKIVNNPLSVENIVSKYPVEGNFLSAKGYLTYSAFSRANENANPLTIRAIFDTFATSTDVVEPNKAQELLDLYKEDVYTIKGKLTKAKLIGFSAVFLLLFLLGFADITAFGHAYKGWFPDWPGYANFPACLIDPETGPWTIPKYWLNDPPV